MRTTFLIDGFNLYHSAVEASRQLNGASTKWLNIRSLCMSYLQAIDREARLQSIYYFSAYARHMQASSPQTVDRHERYIKCLESTGVISIMGRFKEKDVYCPSCQRANKRHEEKETDVAIAVKLLEVLVQDECDIVVIMTGDTDIAPAAKTAQRLFPSKEVAFLFPFHRVNAQLQQMVTRSFKIRPKAYCNHQFPDPVSLSDGTFIRKPAQW